MLTITLVCNLGMSTSMLVDSITKAASKRGLDVMWMHYLLTRWGTESRIQTFFYWGHGSDIF